MHHLDEFVPFEAFDQEIAKLAALLETLGVTIPDGADITTQTYAAFAALYYSVFADERPSMTRSDELQKGAALAGLGDLASKINRAAQTNGFDQIRPHLAKMVEGSVLMNGQNKVTDDAGNKNSELYVGCLALGAGCEIELEDPIKSGGGTNPDVLLRYSVQDWSIAVKTSHSESPPQMFAAIRKAAQQIERSGRPGIVFVNVKNILDRQALIGQSPFSHPEAGTQAVAAQIDRLIDNLRVSIVPEDWVEVFAGQLARPLVALMGQATVSVRIFPTGSVFVPIKVMRVLPVPMIVDPANLTHLNAAAYNLLNRLNHELQRNPGSTAPIGN
ncbi:hypothetical protein [Mesorhizobium sp. CA4]|uniref:hypothetical protein n=1 Tax=Mesorhizobium sp. CA4 TaxID=588499 RepID=UPI001CD16B71|nr:hypothetical protein [Mesorhizobium sp. CA4]MBZ9823204.1 hypothetical protein [Mesorhizobium sp. CA4]